MKANERKRRLKTVNGLVTNVKKHREHEFPEMDKTARIALLMLSKAYLQFLPSLTELPTFSEIWLETLSILDLCNSCSSDELSEAVPEALKNMILVMATQGILHPGWTDSKSINLWNVTWQRARTTLSFMHSEQKSKIHVNWFILISYTVSFTAATYGFISTPPTLLLDGSCTRTSGPLPPS